MEEKKVDAVFDAFLFCGFLFIASATFLYLCFISPRDPRWFPFNVLLCFFFEILFFILMVIYVEKGVNNLLEKNADVKVPRDEKVNPRLIFRLFDRIQISSLIAIGYSIIQLFYPGMDFYLSIIYGLNIFFVALFFIVWMVMKKNELEGR